MPTRIFKLVMLRFKSAFKIRFDFINSSCCEASEPDLVPSDAIDSFA
jgi:hypothetical protein